MQHVAWGGNVVASACIQMSCDANGSAIRGRGTLFALLSSGKIFSESPL